MAKIDLTEWRVLSGLEGETVGLDEVRYDPERLRRMAHDLGDREAHAHRPRALARHGVRWEQHRQAIEWVAKWAEGNGYGRVKDFGIEGHSVAVEKEFRGLLEDWAYTWGTEQGLRPLPQEILDLADALGMRTVVVSLAKGGAEDAKSNHYWGRVR